MRFHLVGVNGKLRRGLLATVLAPACVLLGATGASAATVGQAVLPDNELCGAPVAVQTGVASGTSYTVPSDGQLTSLSTRAFDPEVAEAALQLVVFRATGNPNEYLVVGLSEPVALPSSLPAAEVTTAITPIDVLAGDLIGLQLSHWFSSRCGTKMGQGSDTVAGGVATVVEGEVVTLSPPLTGRLLTIAANLVETPVETACGVTPSIAAVTLVGCWHFDEPPASMTAIDSSPLGNHGTYLNGAAPGAPGVGSTAVALDGVNDYVRVPDSASLDVGDSFKLEGWIKRSDATKSYQLFNKGGNGFQLTVMAATSGGQVWLRKANVTTIARSTAGVPADGQFHHVVVTKNGASVTIYIDDQEAGTVVLAPNQAIVNTTSPLVIGGPSGAPYVLDEFAIFDEALSG